MVARPAALGIAPRSSSAVLVTVSGPDASPQLLDRRRIELVGDDLPAQAYHAAADLGLDEASELIERWAAAALAASTRAVRHIVTSYPVVGVGIVGRVREVPPLETALRSHPLLHVAEGQLSREVLAEAAARARLAVHYLAPKGPHNQVYAQCATQMRHTAGVPWRREHKLATIAALTALSARRQPLGGSGPSA